MAESNLPKLLQKNLESLVVPASAEKEVSASIVQTPLAHAHSLRKPSGCFATIFLVGGGTLLGYALGKAYDGVNIVSDAMVIGGMVGAYLANGYLETLESDYDSSRGNDCFPP